LNTEAEKGEVTMFRRGPWLGQVPLVRNPYTLGAWMGPLPSLETVGRTIRAGESIEANGGRIEKAIGTLWFFPDTEALDKIQAAAPHLWSESIEARVTSCIPLPPIAPTLGAFFDPESGYYCDIDLPKDWRCAWNRWGCL
jgi:hypothetical protein